MVHNEYHIIYNLLIIGIMLGGLISVGTTKLSRNSLINNEVRIFWFLGCAQFVTLHNIYSVNNISIKSGD